MQNPVALLSEARKKIERASSIQELKVYRDQAEAVRQYAKQRDVSLQLMNEAGEVKLRAERKLGKLLEGTIRRGGNAKSQRVTLDELGVSKMESSRWKAESRVPEKQFERFLAERKDAGEEITQAALLRVEKELKKDRVWKEREAQALSLPAKTYQVLLADPPWEFRNASSSMRGAAANHYPTMPLEDIAALPVSSYAARNSVLFLWASNALLPEALEVVADWGFEYKAKMTWVKNTIGTGFYVRSQDEPLLIGTRGAMTPKKLFPSVLTAKKQRHSQKPVEIYKRIEAMYPGLRRVELFARSTHKGWDSWGNEVA